MHRFLKKTIDDIITVYDTALTITCLKIYSSCKICKYVFLQSYRIKILSSKLSAVCVSISMQSFLMLLVKRYFRKIQNVLINVVGVAFEYWAILTTEVQGVLRYVTGMQILF